MHSQLSSYSTHNISFAKIAEGFFAKDSEIELLR